MVNRLADSTSPYLRQHADNPVDWREWGAEAFAEARRRDVPVFVSIGYAACHWCHVMAHESFGDPGIADQLNADFVAIKVDREERPDVDAVYMDATIAMTGQGGWPMSVFCTPDGEPFFCGTYFPPEPRGQMSSFPQLLGAVTQSWREKRDQLVAVGTRAVDVLGDPALRRGEAEGTADRRLLDGAVTDTLSRYDTDLGGVGGAPKFPVPVLHTGMLAAASGTDADARVLEAVDVSLDAMARGGIHDHLAGGFARYSVDAQWAVPHFEKMLSDNALLLRLYARRARRAVVDGDRERASRLLAVCHGIVDWLEGELDTGVGLASSLDADSVDETTGRFVEGAAYVWTPEQLVEALGDDDGPRVAALFGVTRAGSFEQGTSTLRLAEPLTDVDVAWWAGVRPRLLEARRRRPAPGRDDKVVTEWNAQAVTALVEASWAADAAGSERGGEFLDLADSLAGHLPDGDVHRSRLGERVATAPGTLADFAAVATALFHLGAATGERHRIDAATRVLEVALERFADPEVSGRWFDAGEDPLLPFRPGDPSDGATPSGASQLAEALVLASVLGDPGSAGRYRELARAGFEDAAGHLRSGPAQAGGWMLALRAFLDGPARIEVTGPRAAAAAAGLRGRVGPEVLVHVGGTAGPRVDYAVCRGDVCQPPTGNADEAVRLLDG